MITLNRDGAIRPPRALSLPDALLEQARARSEEGHTRSHSVRTDARASEQSQSGFARDGLPLLAHELALVVDLHFG